VRLLLRALVDTLFPPRCHLCKGPVAGGEVLHLCPGCRDTLRFLGSPLCPRCGIPFATEGGADHPCGACTVHPPPFAAARGALLFDGAARDLVHHFKYERRVHLVHPLGLLTAGKLAEFAADSGASLIVPVPLHVRRLRQRGFNQALLLGEYLARSWRLPLARHNLRRIRWTEPQINLSAAERSANVRNAFAVADPARLEGRCVILVDDVFTTGSTVAECSRALRRAGAEAVVVVTAARAIV
jgi:ComF family protein